MMKINIIHCELANREHSKKKRQYAHTFHYEHNTICVADALWDLPVNHLLAILLHEIGHLHYPPEKYIDDPFADFAEDHEKHETAVDDVVHQLYHVKIWRVNSKRWGKNLEWIDRKDLPKAKQIIWNCGYKIMATTAKDEAHE